MFLHRTCKGFEDPPSSNLICQEGQNLTVATRKEPVCGKLGDEALFVVQVPDRGKIYSFNEGNYGLWSDGLKKYIDSLKDPAKWDGKPYSSR